MTREAELGIDIAGLDRPQLPRGAPFGRHKEGLRPLTELSLEINKGGRHLG